MNTIQAQLAKVKESGIQLESIHQEYNMGLITLTEMHNQSLETIFAAKEIVASICSEYDININAVNLMLEL